jgi:hypothetical protein
LGVACLSAAACPAELLVRRGGFFFFYSLKGPSAIANKLLVWKKEKTT